MEENYSKNCFLTTLKCFSISKQRDIINRSAGEAINTLRSIDKGIFHLYSSISIL